MLRFGSGTYNVRDSECQTAGEARPALARGITATVAFLDGSEEAFQLERAATGQALLDKVFAHLELVERDYFGLQFLDAPPDQPDSRRWLQPHKSIRKQMFLPPYTLRFQVKFYAREPGKLVEEYTRYHFYLQLRRDLLEGRLPCPESSAALLGSYAVQSELGDYVPEEHPEGYLDGFRFVADQTLLLTKKVGQLHKLHGGQTPADAELNFLEQAKRLDMYGVDAYDAQDSNGVAIKLGVSAAGLRVFQKGQPMNTFPWSSVLKLSFKRREFLAQLKGDDGASEKVIGFHLMSARGCKLLWQSCIEHHAFFRLIAPPLPVPKGFLGLGTSYRFSGRTEYQSLEETKRRARLERTFHRAGSKASSSATCRSTVTGVSHASAASPLPSRLPAQTPGGASTSTPLPPMSTSWTPTPTSLSSEKTGSGGGANGMGSGRETTFGVTSKAADDQDEHSFTLHRPNLHPPNGMLKGHNGHNGHSGQNGQNGFNGQPGKGYQRGPNGSVSVRPASRPQSRPPPTSRQGSVASAHSVVSPPTQVSAQAPPSALGPASPHFARDGTGKRGEAGRPASVRSSVASTSASPSPSSPPKAQTASPVRRPNGLLNGQSSNGHLSGHLNGHGGTNGHAPSGGADEGLVLIRIRPDAHGRFGFNVKGGSDQNYPIIVSRVAPASPADTCYPRLNEGDQLLQINQRDVSVLSHDQVVALIRAARETPTLDLQLTVRPNVYVGEELPEPEFQYVPESPHVGTSVPRSDLVSQSLLLLKDALASGNAVAQFEQLYRRNPAMAIEVSKAPENLAKNRYRDVLPYDSTRVRLRSKAQPNGHPSGHPNGLSKGQASPSKSTDGYINANFVNMEIPTSGIVNRYIAAQGPLPHTTADFWRVVWDERCALVVMLTATVERGRVKCHQYWPRLYESLELGSGGVGVTCLRERETGWGVWREFSLVEKESGEERLVTQLQYVAWPDHGVPDEAGEFLAFLGEVRRLRAGSVEPMVVHCSAGIGRTGVLILMETAACRVEANEPVYPLELVKTMRDQRPSLIQTSQQYNFVCNAILNAYQQGLLKPLPEYRKDPS